LIVVGIAIRHDHIETVYRTSQKANNQSFVLYGGFGVKSPHGHFWPAEQIAGNAAAF
jgi:hypothetical protein